MARCCFPATSRPGGPPLCTPPLLLHIAQGQWICHSLLSLADTLQSRSARMGTAFPHASAPWCARCRLCSGRDFSADFQRQNDRACDFCILETRRPSSGFVVAGDTQDFTDRPGCQKVIEWRRMPPASCLRRQEAAATPSALPAMSGDRQLGEVVHPVTPSRVQAQQSTHPETCPVGAGEEGRRHGARPVLSGTSVSLGRFETGRGAAWPSVALV